MSGEQMPCKNVVKEFGLRTSYLRIKSIGQNVREIKIR